MACRKMNEDFAYARNTESGCKLVILESFMATIISLVSLTTALVNYCFQVSFNLKAILFVTKKYSSINVCMNLIYFTLVLAANKKKPAKKNRKSHIINIGLS